MARVLYELRDVPDHQRGAYFISVLVLLERADDPAPRIAEGRWHGRILRVPRGHGGFGYDPIFLDPQLGVSAAELPSAEKNQLSHRALALQKLRGQLGGLVNSTPG
jgi:XTP/dITP diphosphohydrolase